MESEALKNLIAKVEDGLAGVSINHFTDDELHLTLYALKLQAVVEQLN